MLLIPLNIIHVRNFYKLLVSNEIRKRKLFPHN